MSKFGGKEINIEEKKTGPSPYLGVGNQLVTITGFDVKVSAGGKKMVVSKVEGKPVTDAIFKKADSSKFGGAVGNVNFTIYKDFENEENITELEKDIQIIANKVGKLAEVKAVVADSVEDYLTKVANVISGKYFWLSITGEEYAKKDKEGNPSKYPGVALSKRRFGFAASETEGEAHLKPFDKTNQYDYKPLPVATNMAEASVVKNDLPF